ncbi:MAG TPA: pyruvate dehydrogenase complex dihydrolipoamide acetyltransferase [Xanthobacteraceae bacterium]|jgi:pyruvate dehydrogenase E2 component (dihydrolipoamide acetyltransferase)|nr:pyruvate dehydrogenase complex dihydrolipoamide acetyltransferase [Xanthobacteraceae bacterium]
MDVLMPQLGETVAEGKITKWFKAAGDKVAPGDNLFEIETDKVSMEVPATEPGVLAEVRVAAGEIAPVGAVVAVISASGAAVKPTPARPAAPPPAAAPAAARAPATAAPSAQPAPAPTPRRPVALEPFHEVRSPERNYGPAKLASGVTVSPLARRLAAEAGIDLAHITASGPHGRILAKDVASASAATPAARAPATGASAAKVMALYAPGTYEEVPLDTMRRTIAARLIEAKQTIPHFYLSADVTIERLMEVRQEANAAAAKHADGNPAFRLSLNDFVIKAWALALQRVPAANAVWAEDRILRFRHSDIGIAVAIEGGLLTPLIRQAETKGLIELSAEMKELAERARARKLKPTEYQGGASAISNLGMYGIREFSAIINPPQSTILAVGAGERRPVETADGVGFVSKMSVTLSCDHRVVDGALGAELVDAFRHFIEHPVGLMI